MDSSDETDGEDEALEVEPSDETDGEDKGLEVEPSNYRQKLWSLFSWSRDEGPEKLTKENERRQHAERVAREEEQARKKASKAAEEELTKEKERRKYAEGVAKAEEQARKQVAKVAEIERRKRKKIEQECLEYEEREGLELKDRIRKRQERENYSERQEEPENLETISRAM